MNKFVAGVLVLSTFACDWATIANGEAFTSEYSRRDAPLVMIQSDPKASPDLLALLAYWKDQERIHADTNARAKVAALQAAIEQSRRNVDDRARSAGRAAYQAQAVARRMEFDSREAGYIADARMRIADADREFAQRRRLDEQNARRASDAAVAAAVNAHSADWAASERQTIAAMNHQRTQDSSNVDNSRNLVRTRYGGSDPAREARWLRASAFAAAEREVRERNTVQTMAAHRASSEGNFAATAQQQAQSDLHARLSEMRARDDAVLAQMRREAADDAKMRTEQFALQEQRFRAESTAQIEQAALERAEEWAQIDASRYAGEYVIERQPRIDDFREASYFPAQSPPEAMLLQIGTPLAIGLGGAFLARFVRRA